jgi:hypothetical protein
MVPAPVTVRSSSFRATMVPAASPSSAMASLKAAVSRSRLQVRQRTRTPEASNIPVQHQRVKYSSRIPSSSLFAHAPADTARQRSFPTSRNSLRGLITQRASKYVLLPRGSPRGASLRAPGAAARWSSVASPGSPRDRHCGDCSLSFFRLPSFRRFPLHFL